MEEVCYLPLGEEVGDKNTVWLFITLFICCLVIQAQMKHRGHQFGDSNKHGPHQTTTTVLLCVCPLQQGHNHHRHPHQPANYGRPITSRLSCCCDLGNPFTQFQDHTRRRSSPPPPLSEHQSVGISIRISFTCCLVLSRIALPNATLAPPTHLPPSRYDPNRSSICPS